MPSDKAYQGSSRKGKAVDPAGSGGTLSNLPGRMKAPPKGSSAMSKSSSGPSPAQRLAQPARNQA